jgi:hypothetical protein
MYSSSTKPASKCTINKIFIKLPGLTHYWPCCESLNDVIGNADLYNPTNFYFYPDRNNDPFSAVYLLNGYLQAPEGVYFDGGDYTVMTWVYPFELDGWSILLFFGTYFEPDDMYFSLSNGFSGFVQQGRTNF